MNICVKYCGGCNPRYDRNQIIKNLKGDFNNIHIFTNFNCSGICDFIIILCGCMTSCVNHENLYGRYGKMVIRTLKDYERLKLKIKQIKKEGI